MKHLWKLTSILFVLLTIWIGLTDSYVATTDFSVNTTDPSILPLIWMILGITSISLYVKSHPDQSKK